MKKVSGEGQDALVTVQYPDNVQITFMAKYVVHNQGSTVTTSQSERQGAYGAERSGGDSDSDDDVENVLNCRLHQRNNLGEPKFLFDRKSMSP